VTSETTTVGIHGEKTTLVFGDRFRVLFGPAKAPRMIEDGRLLRREKNGDLVFETRVGSGSVETRVRPSSIAGLYGSGVEAEETLAEELARQRESDRLVEEFVAEGDTDPDSVAAKVHDELTRRRAIEADPEPEYPSTDEIARSEGVAVESLRSALRSSHPDASPSEVIGRAREIDLAERQRAELGEDEAERRRKNREREMARNVQWTCPECHRRTRKPECSDGHPAVAAPIGKRKENR
jgi:hypothetical protein